MNFINSFEVAAIYEFEIKQKEMLKLPGQNTHTVYDWWGLATLAAT
jgi:hypothetical protein